MPELTSQPIRVATTCADEVGRLIVADGRLVAVLVRLDDRAHGEARGRWHLEAGFGPCGGMRPAPFADLPEALAWVAARVERGAAGHAASHARRAAYGPVARAGRVGHGLTRG